jgi:hypothetical protein
MKILALQCKLCGDIIYSRARHDFHYCSCGNVYIDGGFDYRKWGCADLDTIQDAEIDVDITQKELYDDWNHSIDKYGFILGTK